MKLLKAIIKSVTPDTIYDDRVQELKITLRNHLAQKHEYIERNSTHAMISDFISKGGIATHMVGSLGCDNMKAVKESYDKLAQVYEDYFEEKYVYNPKDVESYNAFHNIRTNSASLQWAMSSQ